MIDLVSRFPRRAMLWYFVLGGCTLSVWGPPAQADSGRWSVDDVLHTESVLEIQVSPNGRQAVWIRRLGVVPESHKLWIAELGDGTDRPLVAAPVTHPRWSPDGRLVGFMDRRELTDGTKPPGPQLRTVEPSGNELRTLTKEVRGLRGFAWRDAAKILFWANAGAGPPPEPSEDRTIVVSDPASEPPVHLFSLELATGDVQQLTTDDDWITGVDVTRDGRRALVSHMANPDFEYAHVDPPWYEVLDLETGHRRRVELPTTRGAQMVAWSAEGDGVYFSYHHTTSQRYVGANEGRLRFLELGSDSAPGDRVVEVDFGGGKLAKSGLQWTHDVLVVPGGVLVRLNDGIRMRTVRFKRQETGFAAEPLAGVHARHIWQWGVSADGETLVYQTSTAETPPQVHAARIAGTSLGAPRQLGVMNPSFAGKPKPRVEAMTWRGAQGEEIEGLVVHPLSEGSSPAPLIVSIHGGPLMRDTDRWDLRWTVPMVLFAQAGARVLRPNYHGSDGYGLAFAESIQDRRYYELPVADVEAGVDHLVGLGLADPETVALHGWSNGAYLSIGMMTETGRRWAAAAVGAGGVDAVQDWGWIGSGIVFFHTYFGGHPWELPPGAIEKLSPFYRLGRVRTPTLVMTGSEDRAVGPAQSWSLYRALQHHGRAPVRFLVFPGEGHMLRSEAHQRRKLLEELRWFDRHLPGFDSGLLSVRHAWASTARAVSTASTTVRSSSNPCWEWKSFSASSSTTK